MAGDKGGGGGKGKARAAAAKTETTTMIPSDVMKTIENLKEMTGNENDEEIYAMLKECGNEPNETAQRLLEQGNFHEVKKKRDRKKEGANPRESADSRGILGPPVWGIRDCRGNDPSRPAATDAGSGRTSAAGKEDLTNQPSRKVNPVSSSPASSADLKINEAASTVSSMTVMANTPIGVVSGGSDDTNTPPSGIVLVAKQSGIRNQPDCTVEPRRGSDMAVETGRAKGKSVATFGNSSLSANPVNCPDAAAAAAATVNTGFGTNAGTGSDAGSGAGVFGTRKNEVNIQQRAVVQKPLLSEPKPFGSKAPEVRSFSTQGKLGSRSQGIGKNQTSLLSQPSSVSSHGGSSRASSNYGSGSLPAVGLLKGPCKEWKPKAISPSTAQGRKAHAVSEELKHSDEAVVYSPPESTVVKSDEVTSDLQEKLHDLNVRDVQHVIIPNHIHVPEAIRTRLSFGSFDAGFTTSSDTIDDSKSEKFATSDSETPEVVPETAIEEAMSGQSSLALMEKEVCVDHPLSPITVPEDATSGDLDVQPALIPETTESKERSGVPEPPITHTSPAYGGFDHVPQMLGLPLAQFESSEMQALGMSTIPGFVVSQQVDPASLYAQLYQSAVDSDGRISPFSMAGVPTKYDGNVAELAMQASESPAEGANSLVMSTSGQAAIATQDAGLMQNSVAVTHQAVPVFGQPAGVHIPHYPANYNPYGHYISQVYIPIPVQQLLSNNALLQQTQAGSGYPSQPTGVKYPASHYKTGSNPSNVSPAGSYWSYGSFPAGYNPGSAVSAGNSTANEDLDASQFKESTVYVTGQQSEGSAVWVATPGRDFSGLQANTFYNLPQGQHVTFTPSQGPQATFAGIYHPLQALQAAAVHPLLQQSQAMPGAVEMVSPTTAVYQQPQLAQVNWPNSF